MASLAVDYVINKAKLGIYRARIYIKGGRDTGTVIGYSICYTGMQVYKSVDSIRWSHPLGRLYILTKRGLYDLRMLLWMS